MSITFFPYLGHYFFKPEKKNTQVIRKWSHEKSICSEIPAHNEIVYNLLIHCMQNIPGQNVYGILRAKRSASTEAVVLTTPMRPKDSDLPSTTGGIVLILAMAKYFRSEQLIETCNY